MPNCRDISCTEMLFFECVGRGITKNPMVRGDLVPVDSVQVLRLGSVPLKKFGQAHAFLKLHFVLRYRLSTCLIKRCQFGTPTCSQTKLCT